MFITNLIMNPVYRAAITIMIDFQVSVNICLKQLGQYRIFIPCMVELLIIPKI